MSPCARSYRAAQRSAQNVCANVKNGQQPIRSETVIQPLLTGSSSPLWEFLPGLEPPQLRAGAASFVSGTVLTRARDDRGFQRRLASGLMQYESYFALLPNMGDRFFRNSSLTRGRKNNGRAISRNGTSDIAACVPAWKFRGYACPTAGKDCGNCDERETEIFM